MNEHADFEQSITFAFQDCQCLLNFMKQTYHMTSQAFAHFLTEGLMHGVSNRDACMHTSKDSVSYSPYNYMESLTSIEKMNQTTFSNQCMQQCTSLFEKLVYKDLQFIKGVLFLHGLPIHHSEPCPFLCDFLKSICNC